MQYNIMRNNLLKLLLVLQLISVCSGVNPCVNPVFIYMANGIRSSDFNSRDSEISLCDAFIDPATWYRFEHDAGNRLVERPVEPWYCGTQAPIWMNGSHPTDGSEVTASVCATYSSQNICGWKGTVRIRLCNDSGGEYFVYQLAVPPGCPLAYCIDAASRKQCISPLVWLQEERRCGFSETTTRHSTSLLSKLITPTALTTISSPSTARQSLSQSTKPPCSDWSQWGPWSTCSKPCDYGFQSRRRTCCQLPCDGPGNANRLCNEYNCQKIPNEETRGVALSFQLPGSTRDKKQDTMLAVVLNQRKIHDIIRKNINDVCSQNVSMCCGHPYNGIQSLDRDMVLPDDIYSSQGSLQPRTDNVILCRIIAIVNEDIDRAICKADSQRHHPRQLESTQKFLSNDVMLMASIKSTYDIYQQTGLVMTVDRDPTTMPDSFALESDRGAICPWIACFLPSICCSVIVVALVIFGVCLIKRKLKLLTKQVAPEPDPDPPNYYDHLSTEMRMTIHSLPDYTTIASHGEYDKII